MARKKKKAGRRRTPRATPPRLREPLPVPREGEPQGIIDGPASIYVNDVPLGTVDNHIVAVDINNNPSWHQDVELQLRLTGQSHVFVPDTFNDTYEQFRDFILSAFGVPKRFLDTSTEPAELIAMLTDLNQIPLLEFVCWRERTGIVADWLEERGDDRGTKLREAITKVTARELDRDHCFDLKWVFRSDCEPFWSYKTYPWDERGWREIVAERVRELRNEILGTVGF